MSELRNFETGAIRKVSAECAVEGKGIEPYYTNEGDRFFRCAE